MAEDTPEVLKKFYPGGFFGYDRDGRPVFIEPLGGIDFQGILSSVKVEQIVKFKRQHCEEAKQMCKEQEEKLEKTLSTYSTLLLDAHGGCRRHLWRPGLSSYKACVKMYEDDFPNLRERIIIVNAPAIFPIVFALLKPLLSQSTRDKIKVLGSNWETELQEYIAADNLPEHYGGMCKDENGSPKCEQHICYGGEVPKSYYITENTNKEDFQAAMIKAGDKLVVTREVSEPNKKIKYQFATSNYDIAFSVQLQVDDGDDIDILPYTKISSHIIMEEGEINCEKVGHYIFTFDNSYSWIHKKEMFYLLQVLE